MVHIAARTFGGWRSAALFVVGLGLTIYEAVGQDGSRPALLALYGGMMGLPLLLKDDPKADDDAPT